MPNLTNNITFQVGGEVSRGNSVVQAADDSLSFDVNLISSGTSSSGAVYVTNSGITFPSFTRLAAVGISFPGVGTGVKLNVNSSGNASGLVQTALTFNSGQQALAWNCSGPAPCPFTTTSGLVTAIGLTTLGTQLSGTISSGAIRLLFYNN